MNQIAQPPPKCPHCGYSRDGLPTDSPLCPECGKNVLHYSRFSEFNLVIGTAGIVGSLTLTLMLGASLRGPNLFGLPDSQAWSIFFITLMMLNAALLIFSISVIAFQRWLWRIVLVVIGFVPCLLFSMWLYSFTYRFA